MTKKKRFKPYGLWPSQVSPEMTGNQLEFSELTWTDSGCLLWKERSSNQASLQIWDPDLGETRNLSRDINIGGGILYGGGSFTVRGDQVILVEKGSNQLYLASTHHQVPHKITSTLMRSATPQLSPFSQRLVFIHSDGELDTIQTLDISDSFLPKTLVSGADFYNYPRWHPDGTHLAWISWNHPHMPWDSSQLWIGDLDYQGGDFPTLNHIIPIAGGEGISIVQPEFSPDGQYLTYISDQSGWWQLYIYNLKSGESRQLTSTRADHGLPPWLQDQRSYSFSSDSQWIYFLRYQVGFASLWQLELESGKESQVYLDEGYTWLESLAINQGDQIALVASGGALPQRIICISPAGESEIIKHSTAKILDRNLFSLPEAISWNHPQGGKVHGLFYKPHHPSYHGQGKPPLILIIHSGPTRQKWAEFQPRAQYFTSRGYAVLEINYRGSTGYGREYWEMLRGNWGDLDVNDCVSGANYLSQQGWVDPEKIALLGSSSGGLTVFQILVLFPGVFKAGISLYGITNHLSLLDDPPKFERHYSSWLLGPYPEMAEVYRARSPLFNSGQIIDPLVIFQGGEDPIVPQDQAEEIVKVLKNNGVPHEYHLYPEEGHGFKKTENVIDFYQKVETFLRKYLIEE